LTITCTVACSVVQPGQRLQLRHQVRGQDQRPEHVAAAHLVDRLLAAVDPDALDPLAERVAGADDVDVLGADLEGSVLRDLIEECDPRLAGAARDRKADQQRDQHRVDHKQRRLQRRAAEDLKVFQQQPAHQCPRWCR